MLTTSRLPKNPLTIAVDLSQDPSRPALVPYRAPALCRLAGIPAYAPDLYRFHSPALAGPPGYPARTIFRLGLSFLAHLEYRRHLVDLERYGPRRGSCHHGQQPPDVHPLAWVPLGPPKDG